MSFWVCLSARIIWACAADLSSCSVLFRAVLAGFCSGYGVSVLNLLPVLAGRVDLPCVQQPSTNANDHPKVAFHLKYLF